MNLSLRAPFGANQALAAAALLLSAAALYPWLVPATATSARPTELPLPSPAIAALPSLDSFAAVFDRPLFSPSRRPLALEKPLSSALAGRYQLLGLISAGDARHALIADGDRHFEIAEGATIDGWAVTRIEQDRIVLSSATGRAVLTLRRAAAVGVEPPAAARPAR